MTASAAACHTVLILCRSQTSFCSTARYSDARILSFPCTVKTVGLDDHSRYSRVVDPFSQGLDATLQEQVK